MYRLVRRSATLALFLTLLLASPDAIAQSVSAYDSDKGYTERVQAHVGEMLRSDDAETQKRGIELIVTFAERDDERIRPEFFRGRLYRVYFDTKADDDVRIAALDAIYSTGQIGDSVPRIVRNLRSDPSDAVRQHTAKVLSELNGAMDAG
jgi:HEAT repeat protein